MMVTFISQCEKKALIKTRRVLDAFANRIGERTWQTIITEDGLIAVKKLLRQTVTKNSAVACHWMRSRSRSELLWIVGNRREFNLQGLVPVNSTRKNHQHQKLENDWVYLPVIKALVAVAALLHDWGKATLLFQKKLQARTKQGDPLRHEWISCLLLNALVQLSGDSSCDEAWLKILIDGELDEKKLIRKVKVDIKKPLENLPPIAQLVAWLIVTHHRLPIENDDKEWKEWGETKQDSISIQSILKHITAQWGYENRYDETEYKKRINDCFCFEHGLLSDSKNWLKAIQKWAARLQTIQPKIQESMDNGAWRLVLHHARLCLMLGDHYYSSCDADAKWQTEVELYANTQVKDKQMQLKQKLDEHLVRVSEQGLKVSQSLSRFTTEMAVAYDIPSLKKKSPQAYEWQDVAVSKINIFLDQNKDRLKNDCGWFVVNMASTGCGKTIANAKVMRALSEDGESLRYILALGLRTLTLQTGDEYRKNIGLEDNELAVLIGSSAIQELHKQSKNKAEISENEDVGSESLEQLLDEELDFDEMPKADFLDVLIPKHKPGQANKNIAFLYKPVLVCTIDHVMAATETKRGGKYILPCLRLLSSDLVIDEVDDFDSKDLIAIGRLIHLAGMLGRKVMISSATIPPALAEGFFNAYQEGWRLHASFKQISAQSACAWIDEFGTKVHLIDKLSSPETCPQYVKYHEAFIAVRVKKLKQQIVKCKAYIVPCNDLYNIKESMMTNEESLIEQYFQKIKQAAINLHQHHHIVDTATGKKVSFGVIRLANIPPCIKLSKYLMSAEWPPHVAPKVMAYHSRQVLLLRHEQEKHLDEVLKRKEKLGDMPVALQSPIIQNHLKNTTAENVLFIVVATPVEEVGRDHDFDWAVIEPSSYRSIIQLAGRVRRHRKTAITYPNIAIMQYNLKALRKDNKPAYYRPGYEISKSYKLATHDLYELLDEAVLNHAINAVPRISPSSPLIPEKRLADLEHKVIGDSLTAYENQGPKHLQGWLTECWWLTALPQAFNRFRESSPDRQVYLVWTDGKAVFHERDERGEFIPRENVFDIQKEGINEAMRPYLWLERDYGEILRQRSEDHIEFDLATVEERMKRKSKRYGELTLPDRENQTFVYSDQFGLMPGRSVS